MKYTGVIPLGGFLLQEDLELLPVNSDRVFPWSIRRSQQLPAMTAEEREKINWKFHTRAEQAEWVRNHPPPSMADILRPKDSNSE